MEITCAICNQVLNENSISPHLRTKHNRIPSKNYYDKYIKKESEGICLTCGKPTRYLTLIKGYKLYCSNKCAQQSPEIKQKIKGIRLNKNDGVWTPDYKEKYTKTCQEKYNGLDSANNDPNVKDKKEYTRRGNNDGNWHTNYKEKYTKTCQEKYNGLDSANNDPNVKDKKKETWLKTLGVSNPNYSEKVLKKRLENFYVKRIPLVKEFLKSRDIELLNEYTHSHELSKLLCKKCNTVFEKYFYNIIQGYGKCPKCYPKYTSIAEAEIKEFLEENLNIEIEKNNRQLIKPYELDIYIPSKNFAIEYNGLYYHSEKFGKDYKYHLNKLNLCEKLNITLIQIFEDEWLNRREVVKSRLSNLLNYSKATRIHARKCIVKLIDCNSAMDFINKYHLQGAGSKSSVNIGAFYKEELISVMTFNHGSYSKGAKHQDILVWELDRFCSNYIYNIPGIASKLLTFFKRNYQWKNIYSYADRRWSTGKLYITLGFSLKRISRPNYWYVNKEGNRIHRYRKRKRENDPKNIPEWFLRLKEGYGRVWDCGNLKFEQNNKKP